jgi:prepilin-type N-terminal cleavage/methylation domain-containing protein
MHMMSARTTARGGFSLIELVIVVVIIGIIAAIAIPRMSRGSQGAQESALIGNLSVLRNAIELFSTEHGGTLPTTTAFVTQITGKTDATGSATIDAGEVAYGPYLREIPPLPVGANQGKNTVGTTLGADAGWIYDPADTRYIFANCADSELSSTGKKFNTY